MYPFFCIRRYYAFTNSFFKCLKELKKIYINVIFIFFLAIEEVSYYMSKEGCPTPGCRGVGNAKGKNCARMSCEDKS